MAWTEVFPLDIVRQNALQIYQVTATTWGNRDTPISLNSLFSPRLATPIYGAGIDPDSDFDQVNIIPSAAGLPSGEGDSIPVTKDSLLAGRFSFPRIKNFDGGFFFRCPATLEYSDLYMDTDGTLKAFGASLNAIKAGTFVVPVMRVAVYIDALTAPPSLSKRPTKNFSKIAAHPDDSIPFFVVPIYGRKLARVTALHTGAANPRLVTINGVTAFPNTPSPATFPNVAFPLTTMSLSPGVVASVPLTNLTCNFLIIKAEDDAAPASLEVLIQTQD
jgi:hypothetical protein